jgi:hypothetical protein
MAVDVALLVLAIPLLVYRVLQSRRTEPLPRRGTELQRTRTVYLVGAGAACLMIAGAVTNLISG